MKKYKKGFLLPLLVIIISLIGIGGVSYSYLKKQTPNESTQTVTNLQNKETPDSNTPDNKTSNNLTSNKVNKYYTYTNEKGGYSIEIPEGWGVNDTDSVGKPKSSIILIPSTNKKITDAETGEIDPLKSKVISIATFTYTDQAKLIKNYGILFKSAKTISLDSSSSIIKEVRKNNITDGCTGIGYAIRTLNKIYSIQGCYPNVSTSVEIESYLKNIISSLKEF